MIQKRFNQHFNKKTAKYIINFKGIKLNLDNNLNNKNLNKIKTLIIDFLSTLSAVFNNKKSEIYFILLSFMKKAKNGYQFFQ